MCGHYAFFKIKYKYGEQTDNCVHTINTEAIAVVVEQGGGVRTLQKIGVNRNQQNKSI